MIGIVSFLMFGTRILDTVLNIASKDPSGDIMTIGNFMVKVSKDIKLETLDFKKIRFALDKHPNFTGARWKPTFLRILQQMKKLMGKVSLFESKNWGDICDCLTKIAFKNSVYFNESCVGGKKNNFEKIIEDNDYCFEKRSEEKVHYSVS